MRAHLLRRTPDEQSVDPILFACAPMVWTLWRMSAEFEELAGEIHSNLDWILAACRKLDSKRNGRVSRDQFEKILCSPDLSLKQSIVTELFRVLRLESLRFVSYMTLLSHFAHKPPPTASRVGGAQPTLDVSAAVQAMCEGSDQILCFVDPTEARYNARETAMYDELQKKYPDKVRIFTFIRPSLQDSDGLSETISACSDYMVERLGSSNFKAAGAVHIPTTQLGKYRDVVNVIDQLALIVSSGMTAQIHRLISSTRSNIRQVLLQFALFQSSATAGASSNAILVLQQISNHLSQASFAFPSFFPKILISFLFPATDRLRPRQATAKRSWL